MEKPKSPTPDAPEWEVPHGSLSFPRKGKKFAGTVVKDGGVTNDRSSQRSYMGEKDYHGGTNYTAEQMALSALGGYKKVCI